MRLRVCTNLAAEAEACGFDGVYVCEAWRSGLIPLAAMAYQTSTVELGSYVLNAFGRSPFITALEAIDLDDVSSGRLLLGVGAGNPFTTSEYQGLPFERPLSKMRDYVHILQKMTAARVGQPVSHEGSVHSIRSWPPQAPSVRERIPVILAATSPRMTELAGECADGIAMGSLLSTSYIREVINPALDLGAARSNRNSASILRYASAFVAVHDDVEVARAAVRRAICNLYSVKPHPHYDRLLRVQGYGQVADAITAAAVSGDVQAAASLIPDSLVDELAVAGDPSRCLDSIAGYQQVADRLVLMNVDTMEYAQDGVLPSEDEIYESYRPILELGRLTQLAR